MNIRHSFLDAFNGHIAEQYTLCYGDYCIHCGLVVDEKLEEMFNKLLNNINNGNYYDDPNLVNNYDDDLEFLYKCIHEKHPCLTEEEFIIKGILE